MPLSSNCKVIPSVFIKAEYCFVNEFSVSVKILMKSFSLKACNSTLTGNLPCNSGSRSLGFTTWKAPDAINKIWSVFIGPYLVETVVPSIKGNRSLWTPSLLTSADLVSALENILSI